MNTELIIITPEELDPTRSLRRENAKLKQGNELLRKLLASAIGSRTVLVTKEIEDAPAPRFCVDENLGGDVILTLKRSYR